MIIRDLQILYGIRVIEMDLNNNKDMANEDDVEFVNLGDANFRHFDGDLDLNLSVW